MELELEQLIEDLGLPRALILEDAEKGRFAIFQHNDDPKYYVDGEVFLDYITSRVTELKADQQKVFWLALKKMFTDNPDAYGHLSEKEREIVLQGLEREIRKLP